MILTSTCISGVNQGSIADLHQAIRRDASPTGRLFGMSNSDPIRSAFDQLPLKEMDAATLVFAIESAVDELAISGETLRLAMEVATLRTSISSERTGSSPTRIPTSFIPYEMYCGCFGTGAPMSRS